MLTLRSCDRSMRAIRKRFQIENTRQRIVPNSHFGSLTAKRLRVVMEIAENGMLWFSQIFLLSELRGFGPSAWTEDYILVQYFDIIAPIDEVDNALNCSCLR